MSHSTGYSLILPREQSSYISVAILGIRFWTILLLAHNKALWMLVRGLSLECMLLELENAIKDFSR